MEGKQKDYCPLSNINSNTKRLATVKVENSKSENKDIDTIVVDDDQDVKASDKTSMICRKQLDFENKVA